MDAAPAPYDQWPKQMSLDFGGVRLIVIN